MERYKALMFLEKVFTYQKIKIRRKKNSTQKNIDK